MDRKNSEMAKRISWKGRYIIISKEHKNQKIVLSEMRKLRRENGSECLFSIETIQFRTFIDKPELQLILDEMLKAGEVYGHKGAYRLN